MKANWRGHLWTKEHWLGMTGEIETWNKFAGQKNSDPMNRGIERDLHTFMRKVKWTDQMDSVKWDQTMRGGSFMRKTLGNRKRFAVGPIAQTRSMFEEAANFPDTRMQIGPKLIGHIIDRLDQCEVRQSCQKCRDERYAHETGWFPALVRLEWKTAQGFEQRLGFIRIRTNPWTYKASYAIHEAEESVQNK